MAPLPLNCHVPPGCTSGVCQTPGSLLPPKGGCCDLKHWGEMLPVFHSQAELSTCHYARSASLSALLYSNLSSALPPSQGTRLVRGNLTQDFHLNPGNQIFSPGALLHCWFLNLLLWSIFSEGGKG